MLRKLCMTHTGLNTLCLDLVLVDLLGNLDRVGDLIELGADAGRALVLATALGVVSADVT